MRTHTSTLVVVALGLACSLDVANAQSPDSWLEPDYQHAVLGGTISIGLADFGRSSESLKLRFLQSQRLSRWERTSSFADSVVFIVVNASSGDSAVAGGSRIGLRIDEVFPEDFDHDGNLDVYISAGTGGNHELSAEGGIYELSFAQDGQPRVTEVLYSDTVPALFDIDRDGLWEFAVYETCWTSAGGGYVSAYPYWARFFKPDTQSSGFVQANALLAPFLRASLQKAKSEFETKMGEFDASPSERAAISAGYAAEGVVAWLTASDDRAGLEDWLGQYEEMFGRLSKYAEFLVPDFEGVKSMALRDFEKMNSPEIPSRRDSSRTRNGSH